MTDRGHSTYPGHEDAEFEIVAQKMEPERLLSFLSFEVRARFVAFAPDPKTCLRSRPSSSRTFGSI